MSLQDFTDEQNDRTQAARLRRLESQQDVAGYRSGQNAAGGISPVAGEAITTGALRSGDPVLLNTDGAIVQQEWTRRRVPRRVVARALKTGNVQVFVTWRTRTGVQKYGWGGINGSLTVIPLEIPSSENSVTSTVDKFGNGLQDWIMSVRSYRGGGLNQVVTIRTIKGGEDTPVIDASYENVTLGFSGSGFWASYVDIYRELMGPLVVEQNDYTQLNPFAAGRRYSDATICTVLGGSQSFAEYCVSGFIGPANPIAYGSTTLENVRTRAPDPGWVSYIGLIASNLGLTRSYREERHDTTFAGWIGSPPGNNYGDIPYGSFCTGPAQDLVIHEGQRQSGGTYDLQTIEKAEKARIASWLGVPSVGTAEEIRSLSNVGNYLNREPSGSIKTYASVCATDFGDTKLVPVLASFVETGATDSGETFNHSVVTDLKKSVFPAWLAPGIFHTGYSTVTETTNHFTNPEGYPDFSTSIVYSADIRDPVGTYDNGRSYSYDQSTRPNPNQNIFEQRRIVSGRGQEREIPGTDISYPKWSLGANRQFYFDGDWRIRDVSFIGENIEEGGKFLVKTITSIGGGPFVENENIEGYSTKFYVSDAAFSYPPEEIGSFYIE